MKPDFIHWCLAVAFASLACGQSARAQSVVDCQRPASTACYFGFEPAGAGGKLHYYASLPPGTAAPVRALIAMHGHPRDANKTFDAARLAVERGGALGDTVVIAPLYQVPADRAARCRTSGVPEAEPGDLLWTCSSWLEGAAATNGEHLGSFAALDALVSELARQWPSLRTITIAGFSAGAQMVQHAVGFAAPPPPGISLRYVVADPGTWLYFDPVRPQPRRGGADVAWADCGAGASNDCELAFVPITNSSACPKVNRWKYGTEGIPKALQRDPAEVRARYREADVAYVEGALDTGSAKGTAYAVLDKRCPAVAQGPYRLERGLAYARYDREVLQPRAPRQMVVVPGCSHDVACVFPSEVVRPLLLGQTPAAR